MLDGVRNRLARNEVGSRLDLRSEPLLGRLQLDGNGRPTREVGESSGEPLVEPRRPDARGDLPQVLDRAPDLVDRRVERRPEDPGLARERELQPPQDDPERHQPLLCPVVQVALEPPALLVPGLDDARSRLLDLRELDAHLDSQARDLDREARGGENAAEQVGAVEQRGRMQEDGDLLAAVLDLRHGAPVGARVADDARGAAGIGLARREPVEQLGAGIPQRSGEHGADLLRLTQPLADIVDERVDALQPVIARPVEAPVDRGLSPPAQWPEGARDDDRGERRDPGRAAADGDTREQRDGGIQEPERRGHGRVDERPVDQPVDLVEPVAGHRDPDRERDGSLRREQHREHRVARLAEHEAPDEEAHDAKRHEQRGIRQPEHLQPLDPGRAPVPRSHRGRADEEAREDCEPCGASEETERVGPASGKRIRHGLEGALELLRHHEQNDEERHRADGEDRVRPPPPRRQPAVGEYEA